MQLTMMDGCNQHPPIAKLFGFSQALSHTELALLVSDLNIKTKLIHPKYVYEFDTSQEFHSDTFGQPPPRWCAPPMYDNGDYKLSMNTDLLYKSTLRAYCFNYSPLCAQNPNDCRFGQHDLHQLCGDDNQCEAEMTFGARDGVHGADALHVDDFWKLLCAYPVRERLLRFVVPDYHPVAATWQDFFDQFSNSSINRIAHDYVLPAAFITRGAKSSCLEQTGCDDTYCSYVYSSTDQEWKLDGFDAECADNYNMYAFEWSSNTHIVQGCELMRQGSDQAAQYFLGCQGKDMNVSNARRLTEQTILYELLRELPTDAEALDYATTCLDWTAFEEQFVGDDPLWFDDTQYRLPCVFTTRAWKGTCMASAPATGCGDALCPFEHNPAYGWVYEGQDAATECPGQLIPGRGFEWDQAIAAPMILTDCGLMNNIEQHRNRYYLDCTGQDAADMSTSSVRHRFELIRSCSVNSCPVGFSCDPQHGKCTPAPTSAPSDSPTRSPTSMTGDHCFVELSFIFDRKRDCCFVCLSQRSEWDRELRLPKTYKHSTGFRHQNNQAILGHPRQHGRVY